MRQGRLPCPRVLPRGGAGEMPLLEPTLNNICSFGMVRQTSVFEGDRQMTLTRIDASVLLRSFLDDLIESNARRGCARGAGDWLEARANDFGAMGDYPSVVSGSTRVAS